MPHSSAGGGFGGRGGSSFSSRSSSYGRSSSGGSYGRTSSGSRYSSGGYGRSSSGTNIRIPSRNFYTNRNQYLHQGGMIYRGGRGFSVYYYPSYGYGYWYRPWWWFGTPIWYPVTYSSGVGYGEVPVAYNPIRTVLNIIIGILSAVILIWVLYLILGTLGYLSINSMDSDTTISVIIIVVAFIVIVGGLLAGFVNKNGKRDNCEKSGKVYINGKCIPAENACRNRGGIWKSGKCYPKKI